MQQRFFPAKLLLFGEHILLRGATALAVPAVSFGGSWQPDGPAQNPTLWQQLRAVADRLPPTLPLDLDALRTDWAEGWYFASNIPQGYGLGSSGALCAALFHRFGTQNHPFDLAELKAVLGQIESSFHGTSSGIDPLTAYLNTAVLIQNQHQVTALPNANVPAGLTVFLADTGYPRSTGGLVNWFLEQCQTAAFQAHLTDTVFPQHEQMVKAWLAGDVATFLDKLRFVSEWQLLTLQPMLPKHPALLDWWAKCLTQGGTYLKICGAGGGGFVLGFTCQPHETQVYADQHGIQLAFPLSP